MGVFVPFIKLVCYCSSFRRTVWFCWSSSEPHFHVLFHNLFIFWYANTKKILPSCLKPQKKTLPCLLTSAWKLEIYFLWGFPHFTSYIIIIIYLSSVRQAESLTSLEQVLMVHPVPSPLPGKISTRCCREVRDLHSENTRRILPFPSAGHGCEVPLRALLFKVKLSKLLLWWNMFYINYCPRCIWYLLNF